MNLSEAIERFPPIWIIYWNPADYPGEFVVRVWYGEFPGTVIERCETAAEARNIIRGQGGCVCLGRDEIDPKVIVECWI
jgi:hypothetical protein